MSENLRIQRKMTEIAGLLSIIFVAILLMFGFYLSVITSTMFFYVCYLYFRKCDEVIELREKITKIADWAVDVINQIEELKKKKPKRKTRRRK